MIWIFLIVETICTLLIYHEKWIMFNPENFSQFVFYTTYVPILVLLSILFCFNEGWKLHSPFNHHNHLHNPSLQLEKPLFETKKCPKSQASFINRVFFLWFTKLILLGRRKPLGTEDMWQLKGNLQAETLSSFFDSSSAGSRKIDIVSMSIKLFARKFLVAIMLTLLTDIFTLLVPILIK